ncbi:hypothetical protein TNCV_122991 [Trichonephila clavipes]|nr:hypothetical protein TNCV_122991 [Trichonephila clavipes]
MGARPGSKNFDFEPKSGTMNKSVREGDAPPFFETSFNLCREVGTIDKYSACVEVGTHRRTFRLCRGWNHSHKHLRRGVNSNNFNYNLRRGEISGIEVFLQLLDTSYVRATREPEKKR